ncbi:hypothetical protein Nepgr_004004 [Nepenthes gracilis]|uniref:Uncharacterized protein n=1 Tax=Nepenthes gracilis TaxID=150966 RepID=A0AAD3S0K5_NEPGR|nr:hypothetical protein Nepgr_004004 [Nepenthes gracilis]
MEKLDVAWICVEIDAGAALPSRIVLQSSDSNPVVYVEYSWKPIRCGQCLLFENEEHNCKAKRIRPSTGKPPRKQAVPKSCPLPSASSVGFLKEVDCPSNSFAPLLSDCHPDVIKDHVVKDLGVQCLQFAEQIVAIDLEEAPASHPPLAAAVPLNLDDARSEESSIAGGKGDVDSDACSNSRNEHVLLSYSELSKVKDNGVCLHTAGHFNTSYADITKRGVNIDGAVDPGNGEDKGVEALNFSTCFDGISKDL